MIRKIAVLVFVLLLFAAAVVAQPPSTPTQPKADAPAATPSVEAVPAIPADKQKQILQLRAKDLEYNTQMNGLNSQFQQLRSESIQNVADLQKLIDEVCGKGNTVKVGKSIADDVVCVKQTPPQQPSPPAK